MGVQFSPHDGTPISLRTVSQSKEPMAHEHKCPSGWWILPAIILGSVEVLAIIAWFVL